MGKLSVLRVRLVASSPGDEHRQEWQLGRNKEEESLRMRDEYMDQEVIGVITVILINKGRIKQFWNEDLIKAPASFRDLFFV